MPSTTMIRNTCRADQNTNARQKFHRIFTKKYRHWRSRRIKQSAAGAFPAPTSATTTAIRKMASSIWLEVNTQPGMTPTSLVPEIAAHAGHSFGELVELDGGGRFVFALRSGQGDEGGAVRPARAWRVAFGRSLRAAALAAPAGAPRRAAVQRRVHAAALCRDDRDRGPAWRRAASMAPVLGGQMPVVVQAVTARTGFAVDQVRVAGNIARRPRSTSSTGSSSTAGRRWSASMPMLARAAHRRRCPGSKAASVRKIYPDTLEVQDRGAQALRHLAAWQRSSPIVERDGNVIVPFAGGRHATLPLVVGYGAAEQARRLRRQGHALSRSSPRG